MFTCFAGAPSPPLLSQFPKVSRFFALVRLRSRGPPGGPRTPREGPRIGQGDLPGASRGPGARVKNLKTYTFCRTLLSGRASLSPAPSFSQPMYGSDDGSATGVCEKKAAGPFKFIGFGGIDVTKLCKFTGFCVIDAPTPYEFIGPAVCISQTPLWPQGLCWKTLLRTSVQRSVPTQAPPRHT